MHAFSDSVSSPPPPRRRVLPLRGARAAVLGVGALFVLACGGSFAGESDPDMAFEGRWCEPDGVCWEFEGDEVVEDQYGDRYEGTWEQDGDLVVMRFHNGPWTIRVDSYSRIAAVVTDIERGQTFTMTRQQPEPSPSR